LVSDGKEGVMKTKDTYPGIAKTNLQTENVDKGLFNRFELLSDERDLSKA
jgi:hypothetical protein